MKRIILSFLFILCSFGLFAQFSGGELWNSINYSLIKAYGEPDTVIVGQTNETVITVIWFQGNLPEWLKAISINYSTRKDRDRNSYIELSCTLNKGYGVKNFRDIALYSQFNERVFDDYEIHMTNNDHSTWLEHHKNSNFPGLEYMFGKLEEGYMVFVMMIFPNLDMPPEYNIEFFHTLKF